MNELLKSFSKNKIIRVLDFADFALLYVEESITNTKYLNYFLKKTDKDTEVRILISISDIRLNEILLGNFSIRQAFQMAEEGLIYILTVMTETGTILDLKVSSVDSFNNYDLIDEDYLLDEDLYDYTNKDLVTDISKLSLQKNKIIVDFYIQGKELKDNIKLWAFSGVIVPFISLVKDILNDDGNKLDRLVGLSNIRQGSLGASIEIPYVTSLFDQPDEYVKIKGLAELLYTQDEDKLIKLTDSFQSDKSLESYIKIINTVIHNDLIVESSVVSPKNKEYKTSINKEQAQKIREILLAKNTDKEDIEVVKGVFVNLILGQKIPSFAISLEDKKDEIIKGNIPKNLVNKIGKDKINFLQEEYEFTLKTVIKPATPFRKQEVIRQMIDYKYIGKTDSYKELTLLGDF